MTGNQFATALLEYLYEMHGIDDEDMDAVQAAQLVSRRYPGGLDAFVSEVNGWLSEYHDWQPELHDPMVRHATQAGR